MAENSNMMAEYAGDSSSLSRFLASRDYLLRSLSGQNEVVEEFEWPIMTEFNWAIDYFDGMATDNDAPAIWIVNEGGGEYKASFKQLSQRSNQVANFLSSQGISRGDRLLLVLGNEIALWETMLAAMKLGAIIIPATTLLTADDLEDRISRGGVQVIIAAVDLVSRLEGSADNCIRVVVGGDASGWVNYDAAKAESTEFVPDAPTKASDPLLLYFTSGTTSRPKLVLHTHESYPVGHLSTMYWIGLRPGDVHLNIASPGWAKHAWSSFFAPWNAGACILIHNNARFDPAALLSVVERCGATSLCAPSTAWRRLIQEDLAAWRERISLRELIGAGEPLNPEIINQIQAAWGLTVRDGYGQTETSAQIGNSPTLPLKPGSMGRPLPGYAIALLDPDGIEAAEGEICIDLRHRPTGLMVGYIDSLDATAEAMRGGYYHTGDTAFRDDDGYYTFIGRADDVFKSSDYRISPFELESILIEHPLVAEAAIVPKPDAIRLAVPKAYLTVTADAEIGRELAEDIFTFARSRTAPYKRIRSIEFVTELPKTISGKIRRVELRIEESRRSAAEQRGANEYLESEFASFQITHN
ncbi:AMP-binding protein [Aquisediminimonas sediminicola]|uniref:AMP-binding protein n=1 Tax=Alteraquisediminimonas sediminicola TaxID=2676787 RepID=UPI001C8E31D8|nr:AMP-binding protein [Aquisediminimonas sediminicola]